MPSETAAAEPLAHRTSPCGTCPTLKRNACNPKAKFPPPKWKRLERTIRDPQGGNAGIDAALFGCHSGAARTQGRDEAACAGWLALFGRDSLRVRLALRRGLLPVEVLTPKPEWGEMYDSWEEMVAHQTLAPGDPDDHLDEDLRATWRAAVATATRAAWSKENQAGQRSLKAAMESPR